MSRTRVGILAVAGAATLLAGCGPAESAVPAVSAPGGRYRDVPADRVAVTVFKADRLGRLEDAHERLRATCLAQRGYPQLAEAARPAPVESFAGLNVTAPGFATMTEQDARRHGFGNDEPAQAAHVLSFDPRFDRALAACTARVSAHIGPDFDRVRGRTYEVMNQISVEIARLSAAGPAAATFDKIIEPVLRCLDAKGFHPTGEPERQGLESYGVGIPRGRLTGDDPPSPKRVPGTVEVLPPVSARRYVPTPQESALAVAAVRCVRGTDFANRYVDQRLRITREVLATREADLVPLTTRVEEMAARAAALSPAG